MSPEPNQDSFLPLDKALAQLAKRNAPAGLYATDRTGERVRGFEVFVPRKGKKTLVYGRGQISTPLTGEEALSCMETLTKRGFEPMARTDGYMEEWLTVAEMSAIYPALDRDTLSAKERMEQF